jgi:hypothetical protein
MQKEELYTPNCSFYGTLEIIKKMIMNWNEKEVGQSLGSENGSLPFFSTAQTGYLLIKCIKRKEGIYARW